MARKSKSLDPAIPLAKKSKKNSIAKKVNSKDFSNNSTNNIENNSDILYYPNKLEEYIFEPYVSKKKIKHVNSADLLDFPSGRTGDNQKEMPKDLNGKRAFNESAKGKNELTPVEALFLDAVKAAIIAERDHIVIDESHAEMMTDVSLSGRFGQLLDYGLELAQEPPARAPRLWDPDGGEPAAIAILDIFGYWIERGRMHQGVLRSLSKTLYEEGLYTRRKPKSREEAEARFTLSKELPTKQQYNDVLLARWDDLSPRQRSELYALKSMRSKSEKKPS